MNKRQNGRIGKRKKDYDIFIYKRLLERDKYVIERKMYI